MKIVSIIVPTYNMEKYLDKCLSSLIIEGFERVEVVVVNDGSKDRSPEIAQTYVDAYPGSFVLVNKENGNYGSCINAGLQKATGKYVKVLDADDTVEKLAFAEMVSILENNDIDLFVSDVINVYSNHEEKRTLSYPANCIVDFTNFIKKNSKMFGKMSMHNVAYRRENLIKINYKQTEGIFYTDNEWIFKPMATVKKMYYAPLPVYRYLLAREGQSVSVDIMQKHIYDDAVVTLKMLKDYSEMKMLNPALGKIFYKQIKKRVVWMYRRTIVQWQLLECKDLVFFDDELKKDFKFMYDDVKRITLSTPMLPFHYISIWRKNHESKFLRKVVKLYYMKKKLTKN